MTKDDWPESGPAADIGDEAARGLQADDVARPDAPRASGRNVHALIALGLLFILAGAVGALVLLASGRQRDPFAPASPGPAAAPPSRAVPQAEHISLVGALQLDRTGRSSYADLAAYQQLAFVGTGQIACSGVGVAIIDISDPAIPREIGRTEDHADTAMEDMQAVRIGGRDVLVVGLQACGEDAAGLNGVELVDVTDPRNPQQISLFETEHGVHELDVTTTPAGRVLALLAVPGHAIGRSADAEERAPEGLLIVDISDPQSPAMLRAWSIEEAPGFAGDASASLQSGSHPGVFLHSVRANADGTRAYLSYWDAGVLILDISDPAQPGYIGRTTFAPEAEGNAHSSTDMPAGRLLIQADEDFYPFQLDFTSGAFTGRRPVAELGMTTPIEQLAGGRLAAELVHLARACPEDQLPADLGGRIALVPVGECALRHKIAVAQQLNAGGVIVYEGGTPVEEDFADFAPLVELPNGSSVELELPVLLVDEETGRRLVEAPDPVDVEIRRRFDGWGRLHIYDISDPARPTLLSTFATQQAQSRQVAEDGAWTAHNPELQGDVLFASWYSDGVRAIDISDPSNPREIGFWRGAGVPRNAPPVMIWGIVPHGDLLLASDMNYGLYILKLER